MDKIDHRSKTPITPMPEECEFLGEGYWYTGHRASPAGNDLIVYRGERLDGSLIYEVFRPVQQNLASNDAVITELWGCIESLGTSEHLADAITISICT